MDKLLPGLPIRVFISYAHDSQAHKSQVRALARLLLAHGVAAVLDTLESPVRRDWQLWATQRILASDFILIIASEQCRLVGDGQVRNTAHLGLQSEMRLLRELYHHDPEAWVPRMLPVVLPGRSVAEIPLFLQPRTADHFIVRSLTRAGAADLLRALQWPAERPPASGLAACEEGRE